jgi:hypothetical protein
MPLPNVTNGASKQCRARTKSRNLEPCLNLAAHGTAVCRNHGAVHPDKRVKGKSHGNYKKGNFTKDKLKEQTEQIAVIRNLEDALIVLGSIDNRTRGNKPKGYQDIQTLVQVGTYLLELENIKTLH